jgi:hypothetical protein
MVRISRLRAGRPNIRWRNDWYASPCKLGDELLPRLGQGHARPVVQQEAVLVALAVSPRSVDPLLERGHLRQRRAEILEAFGGQRVLEIDPRIGPPLLERFRGHLRDTLAIQILHDPTLDA